MTTIDDMVQGIQTIAIICNQWGDTGKGKYSDYFAAVWADVIARGTGGNNAGHTAVVNGIKRVFHVIPAGIIYDKDGKINILGNGMVLDLSVLCGELDELDKENVTYNHLMISEDAQVILPFQIQRDQKKNQSLKGGNIGSTGRGIGPCYADKTARKGVSIRDLYNTDKLREKIKKLKKEFYPGFDISTEQVMENLKPFADRIKPFVRDTISEMHKFYKEGKKILLEGAQGLLLSIEFGTAPYVTSSDCSLNGTASGVGLSARAIDLPLGIVKFPFMTRVGSGPFPSEFGGAESEEYCAESIKHDIFYEAQEYLRIDLNLGEIRKLQNENNQLELADYHKQVREDIRARRDRVVELVNSDDPFLKGVGIRLAGEEYGATTGRPRRTGWTDLVALKYAVGINGPNIILTKPDVMRGAEEFGLVDSYKLDGKEIGFTRDCETLSNVVTSAKMFKGFDEDLSGLRLYGNAPSGLRDAIIYLEIATGARTRILSVGPDQSQTIILN